MFKVITQYAVANSVECSECQHLFNINPEHGIYEDDKMIFVCPSCGHKSREMKVTKETKLDENTRKYHPSLAKWWDENRKNK